MKQVAVVVLVLAACGSKQAAPTTGNASSPTATAVAPPTLPAEWASIYGGKTVSADLDGDGTAESIHVEDDGFQQTVTIDGAPYTCATEDVSTFGTVSIIDLEPALPGLELVVSGHLSDDEYAYCYIAKIDGKLVSLSLYNSSVDGNLILVEGNCSNEPTVYKRTATGFEEDQELAADKQIGVRCCEGPDCP